MPGDRSAEKLRIGVVGLGTFVEIAHFPAYFESPYREFIEVAAVCDLDSARLATIASKYGVAGRYTDHRTMLEHVELDALVVVTPDHAHTPIVLDAIDAGRDVLVEKPLTMKTSEARQILDAAERAGVGILVLTHYLPPIAPGQEADWRARAATVFPRQIELGDDLHRVEVHPGVCVKPGG